MLTDKEIEEAIEVANNSTGLAVPSWEGKAARNLRDAYLSMKAERNDYKYLLEHERIASSKFESERDKYKAIVEADRIALECFDEWWHQPNSNRTIGTVEGAMVLCKEALAFREKES